MNNHREEMANQFAAYLLMPEEEFKDIYNFYLNLDYKHAIIDTARWFGVTPDLVEYRLKLLTTQKADI